MRKSYIGNRIIYKITLPDGRYYIGQHRCSEGCISKRKKECKYSGSGTLLIPIRRKYGASFLRSCMEILHEHISTEEELDILEDQEIGDKWKKVSDGGDPLCMNYIKGGNVPTIEVSSWREDLRKKIMDKNEEVRQRDKEKNHINRKKKIAQLPILVKTRGQVLEIKRGEVIETFLQDPTATFVSDKSRSVQVYVYSDSRQVCVLVSADRLHVLIREDNNDWVLGTNRYKSVSLGYDSGVCSERNIKKSRNNKHKLVSPGGEIVEVNRIDYIDCIHNGFVPTTKSKNSGRQNLMNRTLKVWTCASANSIVNLVLSGWELGNYSHYKKIKNDEANQLIRTSEEDNAK